MSKAKLAVLDKAWRIHVAGLEAELVIAHDRIEWLEGCIHDGSKAILMLRRELAAAKQMPEARESGDQADAGKIPGRQDAAAKASGAPSETICSRCGWPKEPYRISISVKKPPAEEK